MELYQKVTPQTLILTPNRRLAAYYLNDYQQYQKKLGHKTWASLDILPYSSWLERTWITYTAANFGETRLLLLPSQELTLWEKIISHSPQYDYLLQTSSTAEIAKSAWAILKQWNISLNSTELLANEDTRVFLQWAKQFQQECRQNEWIDHHSLADNIYEYINHQDIPHPTHIILLGFTEITPQQQKLFDACQAQGCSIDFYHQKRNNLSVSKIALTDQKNEIQAMAQWARYLLEKHHNKKHIACVIPKLEDIRDEVSRIFTEVFTNEGNYTTDTLELPFNISAGKSLVSYPIIKIAIQLLEINSDKIDIDTISSLLRTPYVGDAETEMLARANLDYQLHNENYTTISIKEIIQHPSTPLQLKYKLKKYSDLIHDIPDNQQVSYFVDFFINALKIWGWPGERIVNSEEFQLVERWMNLLDDFRQYEMILGGTSYQTILRHLKRATAETVFQPQSPQTPIQILGIFEAAEIPFDYIWVMGMDDITWPPTAKPNPFIPLQLQKSQKMPHSSAQRELEFCQLMTKQLQACADEVIFSHPLHSDESELRESPLIEPFSQITLENLNLYPYKNIHHFLHQHKKIELYTDEIASKIPDLSKIKGGARLFELQSACPFKAFSELRLYAKPMETPISGLRAIDRGNIIHKALEIFWREVMTSEKLKSLPQDELNKLLYFSIDQAITMIIKTQDHGSNYINLERERTFHLIHHWIEQEKLRPAFNIYELESKKSLTIDGMTVNIRIDRIDLINNEKFIIDYKTGKNPNTNAWFGTTLDAPQLPLYCLIEPTKTAGIAFGVINAEKVEIRGVSKDSLNIKNIDLLEEPWDSQIEQWKNSINFLAKDFMNGNAKPYPKYKTTTCKNCQLKPACRIYDTEIALADEEQ